MAASFSQLLEHWSEGKWKRLNRQGGPFAWICTTDERLRQQTETVRTTNFEDLPVHIDQHYHWNRPFVAAEAKRIVYSTRCNLQKEIDYEYVVERHHRSFSRREKIKEIPLIERKSTTWYRDERLRKYRVSWAKMASMFGHFQIMNYCRTRIKIISLSWKFSEQKMFLMDVSREVWDASSEREGNDDVGRQE